MRTRNPHPKICFCLDCTVKITHYEASHPLCSARTQQPTPDYGEPWYYDDDLDFALTRNGSAGDERRIVECVNACAGMADPAAEITAMREAIREAETFLTDIAEYWNRDENESAMSDACWHAVGTAEKALAKLQPFITQEP
jgi:hypothetical protein